MKLEEEIKQSTPFRNPWQRAAVNLIFTNNWLVNEQRKMFDGVAITIQQFNVLRILRGQHPNPISTSDIRERMLDRRSDVSRIVDRLVKKELVIRKPCQNDKRLVDVLISENGLELLSQLDQRQSEFQDIMGSLDEAEVDQLNELLDKLRNASA